MRYSKDVIGKRVKSKFMQFGIAGHLNHKTDDGKLVAHVVNEGTIIAEVLNEGTIIAEVLNDQVGVVEKTNKYQAIVDVGEEYKPRYWLCDWKNIQPT